MPRGKVVIIDITVSSFPNGVSGSIISEFISVITLVTLETLKFEFSSILYFHWFSASFTSAGNQICIGVRLHID